MTRPRGFAPWSPRAETLVLLDTVKAVLNEYADYLPLTIRQVFYRLVGAHDYDKTETAYSRLCETMNRARRANRIPFSAIRDDGGTRLEWDTFTDTSDFVDYVGRLSQNFKLDRQQGQPVRLWVLCEAAGMAPMLARAANPYGVPVLSSGGFDSLTAKHQLAKELAGYEANEILHIGDHDPSGVHLFNALSEDVTAMVKGLEGIEPIFTRLAVTPAQALEMNLPTAPAKKTDRRAFQGATVQAEAIPPDVLSRIVAEAIQERHWVKEATDHVLTAEQTARAELQQWIERAEL